MKPNLFVVPATIIAFVILTAEVPTQGPSAPEIVRKVLSADPFGLAGAVVTARLILKQKSGATSQLAFTSRSMLYDAPYAKSIVRFTTPPDMAGAGFLQIQKRDADDDRFLFLPELKRSRRISGTSRANSFMGTDFTFADLDRRDWREGDAVRRPDETLSKFDCYRVDITTKRSDSPYSRIEAWIRKDNLLPLKLALYDRGKTLSKTFAAQEVKRVSGQWYITKSQMTDQLRDHSTVFVIDNIAPLDNAQDDEFTVRNLEKF